MSQVLWTNQYLSDLATEAEIQISSQIPCLYVRRALNITANQSIYDFQNSSHIDTVTRFTGIIRITWQGWTVHPVFQNQLRNMVVPLKPGENEVTSSRPLMYFRLGYGQDKIKFYPAPSATITYDSSNLNTKTSITNNVIVSGWTVADPTGSDASLKLPDYIRETLIRYYVMSRAFRKEGKGHNLEAAKYYDAQFEKLFKRFKHIVENLFKCRTHAMGDMFLNSYGVKPPHPRLPTNFGTPVLP